MNLYFTFEFRNCLDLFSASKLLSELAQAKYVSQRSQNKPHYPLDSDLSGGERYPPFEQPGSGV